MKTDLQIGKVIVILISLLLIIGCSEEDDPSIENPSESPYNINIDPSNFRSGNITGNTYFPISTGTTYVYIGEDEDGESVKVVEEYTADTKVILGVTCVIVHATEYENEELVEDTYDWYAQDLDGNIWYFGEYSEEIENGIAVSTEGSWEAGVDGALPGIIMLANPIPGLWYRQEYFENEAEDVGQVLSLSESVSVEYGNFTNCLMTAEWTPLEPGIMEYKYYASEIGLVKVEVIKGESGYEELSEIN